MNERYDTAHLFSTELDWLVVMAQNPGTKGYAWDKAKRYESAWPDVYAGLPEALEKRMKELKGETHGNQDH